MPEVFFMWKLIWMLPHLACKTGKQKLYFLEGCHKQMCTGLHFIGLNLMVLSTKETFSPVSVCSACVYHWTNFTFWPPHFLTDPDPASIPLMPFLPYFALPGFWLLVVLKGHLLFLLHMNTIIQVCVSNLSSKWTGSLWTLILLPGDLDSWWFCSAKLQKMSPVTWHIVVEALLVTWNINSPKLDHKSKRSLSAEHKKISYFLRAVSKTEYYAQYIVMPYLYLPFCI